MIIVLAESRLALQPLQPQAIQMQSLVHQGTLIRRVHSTSPLTLTAEDVLQGMENITCLFRTPQKGQWHMSHAVF